MADTTDFNLPTEERLALLKDLQAEIGDVPLHFWAACQLCDLQSLTQLVQVARISPAVIRVIAAYTIDMVKDWTQGSRIVSQTPTASETGSSPSSPIAKRRKISSSPAQGGSSSPLLLRNQTKVVLAKRRDGNACVLTASSEVHAAHIYPFCWIKGSEEQFGQRHNFWNMLENFWPETQVKSWKEELFYGGDLSRPGKEMVENLITLSTEAHGYWNRGAFALKPISITADTLKVQLFWQKKQVTDQVVIGLDTIPTSTAALTANEGGYEHGDTFLATLRPHFRQIVSGDIFEIKTEDASTMPLPSFELLRLQWFLTRVVGMAGAAYPSDYEWEKEEFDDGGVADLGLELENEGDISFQLDVNEPYSPELVRAHDSTNIAGFKHHLVETHETDQEELIV